MQTGFRLGKEHRGENDRTEEMYSLPARTTCFYNDRLLLGQHFSDIFGWLAGLTLSTKVGLPACFVMYRCVNIRPCTANRIQIVKTGCERIFDSHSYKNSVGSRDGLCTNVNGTEEFKDYDRMAEQWNKNTFVHSFACCAKSHLERECHVVKLESWHVLHQSQLPYSSIRHNWLTLFVKHSVSNIRTPL